MRRSSRSVLPTCSVTSATVPTPRRYLCGVSKPGSGYVPLNDPNPRPPHRGWMTSLAVAHAVRTT